MLINSIINNPPYIKNSSYSFYSINFGRKNQLGENDNFKKSGKNLSNNEKPKTNCDIIGKIPPSPKFKDMPYETWRVLRSCAFKEIRLRHIWYLKDDTKLEYLISALTELAEETEKEFGHILCGSDKTTIEYFAVSDLLNAIHRFIDEFKKEQKPKN